MLLVGSAQAETTFTVAYKPPEGCPDRGAFIHGIQSRSRIAKPVGAAEQPDIVFSVDIKQSGPGKSKVTGKLVITQGITSSDRTVTGVSCVEVTTALALIAALSIDPDAANVDIPEPLPLPPDWSGPPILGSQPALRSGAAPTILPAWAPPVSWRPAMIPPPTELDTIAPPLPADAFRPGPAGPSKMDIGFGAQFVLDVGPAPTPLVGIAGQVELRELGEIPWSMRAELSYALTAESTVVDAEETGLVGDYRMLRGRFIGCVPAWRPVDWLRLWPCATFGGGGQWAVFRVPEALKYTSVGPWVESGLAARVDLTPLPWLAVELQAGPSFAIVRATFKAGDDLIVYEPLPVTFGLATGVTAAF